MRWWSRWRSTGFAPSLVVACASGSPILPVKVGSRPVDLVWIPVWTSRFRTRIAVPAGVEDAGITVPMSSVS